MVYQETPETRRRRLLPRETLFVTAMAGKEVQRHFLFRQRLVFTASALVGLATMWAATFVEINSRLAVGCSMLSAAVLLWGASAAVRWYRRQLQLFCFFFGFLAFGGAVGILVGQSSRIFLANPTILVGISLAGSSLNTLLFKKEQTRTTDFLLTGPWLAIACFFTFFFPAGEWVLAVSGAFAVFFVFLLHYAAGESLRIYQPNEYLYAAADVVPIAIVSAWKSWSGQG